MTSLTAPAPLAVASPTVAVMPPVFGPRIIIGLVGVLLAVLVSGLNEMVTKVALADIRGALAIGYDEGTWLVASYTATSVAAMAFAPWCSVTFSLRRFTLCAISVFTLLGVLCPFAPNYESLLLMRTLQGLAGGALQGAHEQQAFVVRGERTQHAQQREHADRAESEAPQRERHRAPRRERHRGHRGRGVTGDQPGAFVIADGQCLSLIHI